MSITSRRHPPAAAPLPEPAATVSTEDRVGLVIVAAGVSSRMDGLDKVTADLGGRPVLTWSFEAGERCPEIAAIALVVHPERRAWAEEFVRAGAWRTPVVVCAGGERRQDSVAAGVAALDDVAWVAVHDAARPFAGVDLFRRCIAAARDCGGCALAAVPVRDTLKRVDGREVVATLSRDNLWAAQTPQVCLRATLLEGLDLAAANGWSVTDEAMLMEQLHAPVVVVPGDVRNFKLTTRDDLLLARALVTDEGRWRAERDRGRGDEERETRSAPGPVVRPVPRVGLGYDIHRLVPGRRLVLGGVEIAHELGLDGHSDADVL